MTTPLPEAQQPATVPRPAPRISGMKRAFGRFGGAGNPMARGLLLFAALVLFTLLYAVVLGWLSESNDGAASQPQPAVVKVAPAVTNGSTVAKASSSTAVATTETFRTVDDGVAAAHGEHFTYTGVWQHLTNMHDGRSEGTSSRTYHVGAAATFDFTGDRLKIFGVKGPGGGYAELRIDGETYGLLRFYANRKEPGVLIYTSPALPLGPHAVQIVVAEPPNGLPKRRFVNLDGASYAGR